jgi:hypothetical protein
VVPVLNSDELTIWDSQESEFSTGLEFCRIYRFEFLSNMFCSYSGIFSETICDLDWTSTPDFQSILAVGFLQRIDLLCQRRSTYFDDGPGWETVMTVDISRFGEHFKI